jgi:hypothetical protein
MKTVHRLINWLREEIEFLRWVITGDDDWR